jgi:hypothetical protein
LALERLGLGPHTTPSRTLQKERSVRLLAYQEASAGRPAILIVPAPFAVCDPRSRVVPPPSIEAYRTQTGSNDAQILDYAGDTGVMMQHVACWSAETCMILSGRACRAGFIGIPRIA